MGELFCLRRYPGRFESCAAFVAVRFWRAFVSGGGRGVGGGVLGLLLCARLWVRFVEKKECMSLLFLQACVGFGDGFTAFCDGNALRHEGVFFHVLTAAVPNLVDFAM